MLSQVRLALVGLEGNETGKSDTVTEELKASDGVSEEKHGAKNEENVLDNTSESEGQGAGSANEEDGGDVKTESNAGVCEENKGAKVGDLEEGNKTLGEWEHESVDGSANRGKVVEGDEGVHLETLEENLDHDKTRRLESDGKNLADETRHGKVTLSVGSKRHTERDAANDHGKSAGELLEAKCERNEKNGDGSKSLKHLNEADTEGEVSHVAEDERAGEKGADGQNVLDPSLVGHFHIGKAVKEVGVPRQKTGSNSGKSHVEGCEEDRIREVELVGIENEPVEWSKIKLNVEKRRWSACALTKNMQSQPWARQHGNVWITHLL